MTELERALVALGRELDIPAGPDLGSRVRERIERKPRRRRVAVLALALLVALGIALAVPPARSAILRFFHIGSVTIERVETLPHAQERSLVAGLGPPLSLREAEKIAGVALVLNAPRPRRFYAQPGLIATLLHYRGTSVLLAELQGDQMGLTKKFAAPGTSVQPASIGTFGLWLEGGKHVLMWSAASGEIRQMERRLAGNVLIWTEGNRTYRLEGGLNMGQMLELGRQITR
ncbi:MAG: hypothetical protein E6G09_15375 [Actinobacteria bacterium]|nr:MAG: hypothetical protein E6G09_15375 [Actinomycetota bacterium]